MKFAVVQSKGPLTRHTKYELSLAALKAPTLIELTGGVKAVRAVELMIRSP